MVLGKRRSPRNKSKTNSKEEASPPRKKRKIERTPTVEVIDEDSNSKTIIERKTTSFLEEEVGDENISSLSTKSRSKLIRRLSSILNTSNESLECKEIDLCRKEGFLDYYTFIVSGEQENTLYGLPMECIRMIFKYLSDFDRRNFGLTCKKMDFILQSFVGYSYLPVDKTNSRNPFILYSQKQKYCLSTLVKLPKTVLNVRKLSDYIRNRKELPEQLPGPEILDFWSNEEYSWISSWYGDLIPSRNVCQPKGLSLCLYDYQAKGLTWMLSIERMVKNKTKFVFSNLFNIPSTMDIVFDTCSENPKLIYAKKKVYDDKQYKNYFTTQGGMFCDEMGLGKTISLISLILSNPRNTNEKGQYIPCIHEYTKSFFQTKSTLIVCPSHIVSQWSKEIESHSTLTYRTVATAAQHKKLYYQDILDTDVIIVSSKFLENNPRYKSIVKQYEENPEIPELNYPSPLLQFIGWHRIIVDEAHEIVEITNGLPLFFETKFNSNYRWYVTGTPLKNGENSMDDVLEFLNCIPNKTSNYYEHNIDTLSKTLFHRAVKRSLFWRNTKDSVENQITIPSLHEEIEFVTISPIERTIYESLCFEDNNEIIRRRFISDPTKYTKDRSLNDTLVPFTFLKEYKSKITKNQKNLLRSQRDLLQYQNSLKKDTTLSKKDEKSMKSIINRYQKVLIPKYEKLLIQSICQACISKYLAVDESTEICEGCDEYANGRVKLPCGDILCQKCIQKLISGDKYICIKCDSNVDITKLQFIDEEYSHSDRIISNEYEEPWFTKYRAKYGSKFAYTTRYLKNIMNSSDEIKMIVFSQFEGSLLKLSSVLEEIDPEMFTNRIVMCKGNLHARKRQLERFTETGPDSARILLLSLKNSASGTHLASATHILLLDQVAGTEGEAKATDAQAIARAHRIGQTEQVTAIRFIAINTIDQEDYERAYGTIIIPNPLGPKSARK